MRITGLEPAREAHWYLKPARLPIPPYPHINFALFPNNNTLQNRPAPAFSQRKSDNITFEIKLQLVQSHNSHFHLRLIESRRIIIQLVTRLVPIYHGVSNPTTRICYTITAFSHVILPHSYCLSMPVEYQILSCSQTVPALPCDKQL